MPPAEILRLESLTRCTTREKATHELGGFMTSVPGSTSPVDCTNLSILVPTKNRRLDLESLLSALLPQIGPSDEILVVDNGSSDSTLEYLQGVARRDARVKFIVDGRPNLSKMLNGLAQVAKNEAIALFNDDCIPVPTWVSAVKHGLSELPDAAVLGGAVRDSYDRRLIQESRRSRVLWRVYDIVMLGRELDRFGVIKDWGSFSVGRNPPPMPAAVTCLSAANMVIRKHLLMELGWFDEDFWFNHFDGMLFVELMRRNYRCYYITGADVIHNTGSPGSARSAFNIGRDTAVFLKKLQPRSTAGRLRRYLNVLSFLAFWAIRSRVEGVSTWPAAIKGFLSGV